MWQRAVVLLRELQSRGPAPTIATYNAALSACASGGQWKRALELLAELPSRRLAPNQETFDAAIEACERGGQWERAVALLAEPQACRVQPSVTGYGAAISACERGGQWERALGLLVELRTFGLEPNEAGLGAAISACEQTGQWERASALLLELQSRGIQPFVETYNAAISAYEQGGQWERAVDLFRQVEDSSEIEPDVATFNIVLDCLSAPQPTLAQEIWRDGVARGVFAAPSGLAAGHPSAWLDVFGCSEGAAEAAVCVLRGIPTVASCRGIRTVGSSRIGGGCLLRDRSELWDRAGSEAVVCCGMDPNCGIEPDRRRLFAAGSELIWKLLVALIASGGTGCPRCHWLPPVALIASDGIDGRRWCLRELEQIHAKGERVPPSCTVVTGRRRRRPSSPHIRDPTGGARQEGDLHARVGAVLDELGVPAAAAPNRSAFTVDIAAWVGGAACSGPL